MGLITDLQYLGLSDLFILKKPADVWGREFYFMGAITSSLAMLRSSRFLSKRAREANDSFRVEGTKKWRSRGKGNLFICFVNECDTRYNFNTAVVSSNLNSL